MSAAPYPWLDDTWRRLTEYRDSERMPHALLLTGPAGLGKLELARAFLNYVLCRQPAGGAPCGTCDACVQWAAGSYPDFHEITLEEDDRGKLRKQIVVQQIRDLSAEMSLTSRQGGWKTVLLQPADAMNVNAANSLLKTLEEPAPRSLLLLVSSRPASLPATIRSRCQHLTVPRPEQAVAAGWLSGQGIAEPGVALAYAGMAPLRARALSQAGFLERRGDLLRRVAAIHQRGASVVAVSGEMEDEDTGAMTEFLASVTEDLIRVVQLQDDASRLRNPDLLKLLKSIAQGVDLAALHRYREAVEQARRLAETPVNPRLLLESLLLPWAAGMGAGGTDKILERLLEG